MSGACTRFPKSMSIRSTRFASKRRA
jgi:hypothetical protein